MAPKGIVERVNSLLLPLKPYVYKPRKEDLATATSDWSESAPSEISSDPSSKMDMNKVELKIKEGDATMLAE